MSTIRSMKERPRQLAALKEVCGSSVREIDHWVEILDVRIKGDVLSEHHLACIGAALHLTPPSPKGRAQMKELFLRLAFTVDPDSEWTAVRRPRQKPELLPDSFSATTNDRKTYQGKVFEKQRFLDQVRQVLDQQ